MSVVWNANIPQPTDLVSTSQGQILQNNQSINSVFNDGTNGVFTKYLLQNVGTIASVTDPVSALHAINGAGITFNGKPIPYFKNSVGDYPIMPDIKTGSGSSGVYSFQLGNLIVNYGEVSVGPGVGYIDVTLNQAFATTNYFVVCSLYNIAFTSQAVSNKTTTGFRIGWTPNASGANVDFIAIGY